MPAKNIDQALEKVKAGENDRSKIDHEQDLKGILTKGTPITPAMHIQRARSRADEKEPKSLRPEKRAKSKKVVAP